MKYLSLLILIFTISFHLWLNYPETGVLAHPNDDVFQYSLVYRTNWVWQNYGCPISLSCLPNLIDHNVSAWAEGYPLPFYYPHIPQIMIVSSYNLVIKPLSSLLSFHFSLFNYYNWTKYLLLSFFPISIYLALIIVGFNPLTAATGTLLGSNFSTDGLYGIDPPSFLWRGYGLTSQLYAILFLPISIAFTFKALTKINPDIFEIIKTRKYIVCASIFLILTAAGHLGMGIVGLLSTIPFLFFDINIKHLITRGKRVFLISSILIVGLAYFILPVLLYDKYHMISFWDPIWKFNSYGWFEVGRQFLSGETFDWQRFPVITGLAIAGFFILIQNPKLFPFAFLFVFWMLIYFGRTTWDGLLDLIPGMKDFHQHRFIVPVQIAGIFLMAGSLEYIFIFVKKTIDNISSAILPIIQILKNSKLKTQNSLPAQAGKPKLKTQNFNEELAVVINPDLTNYKNVAYYILIFCSIFLLGFFTLKQTVNYANFNNKWIKEANTAYMQDKKNFENLVTYMNTLPNGRVYAGRPGNWGKDFRLGSTQLYMLLGTYGFDMSQFLPETWSPLSENEQNFDERVIEDYNLLNIRYIVAPKNQNFPDKATLLKEFGFMKVYEVPTTGWFDLVASPMFVKTDKTNFINLVNFWHRSYARRWNMNPLISVESKPNIPNGTQKVIRMVDEVNYKDITNNKEQITKNSQPEKNIFADYPFIFPEATVSGKIKEEKVEKQSYSSKVEVPENCKQCFVMFKMSYHPDWIAKVDGQNVDKFAVFPFYLAVQITPGTHTVEFSYVPNRLKIILLTMEILLLIILIIQRRKIFGFVSKLL